MKTFYIELAQTTTKKLLVHAIDAEAARNLADRFNDAVLPLGVREEGEEQTSWRIEHIEEVEPEPIIRCSAYDGGQGCLRPATEFSDSGYSYCSRCARCWKLASTEGE